MDKQKSKQRTVDQIKKERKVEKSVKDNLKQFNRMKRSILEALKEGAMTIPELSEKLDAGTAETTYYVMTLRKYGLITAGEQDDMDEYFYYHLKEQ